ncbi:MAG: hypothetical protein JO102_07610 [Elusimicrobia bacterium]|nr:hypothetical protein [Elusimicrobiota bacterium]
MIAKFNAVAAEETRRVGARYVNITTVSRYAARNPKLTASDGLHPSPQMHGLWARLIYTTARPILGTRLH